MGRFGFAIDADADRLTERARQDRAEFIEQAARIDRLRVQALAAGEG